MPDQEFCEVTPSEILWQFGEELRRRHPRLTFFHHDADADGNLSLDMRGNMQGHKKEVRVRYDISEKRFIITSTGSTFVESTPEVETALFLVDVKFTVPQDMSV